MDNQAAIAIIINPDEGSNRTKHIDVQANFSKSDYVENKTVFPIYIETSKMLADTMTKQLTPDKFESFGPSCSDEQTSL
ncbi:hypothetical protein HK105_201207 [Polyrhizophydium stewartii]|uniref:Uncharacterized protein n=1 Tax=Polyrhizophydium stewartii TaxID=2732419 RepID=A0ABR4NJB4_9FUNG